MSEERVSDSTARGKSDFLLTVSDHAAYSLGGVFLLTLLFKVSSGGFAQFVALLGFGVSIWWIWSVFTLAVALGEKKSSALTMALLMFIPIINIVLTLSMIAKAKKIAASLASPADADPSLDGKR